MIIVDSISKSFSGNLVLDIGQHDLIEGSSIKLANESIIFTCAADSDQTQHAYPRASGQGGATADDPAYDTAVTILNVGSTSHQPEIGSAYNPITGQLTIKLTGHNFQNGDRVQFEADSLIFTCEKDNNATQHTYPRTTDPVIGKKMPPLAAVFKWVCKECLSLRKLIFFISLFKTSSFQFPD